MSDAARQDDENVSDRLFNMQPNLAQVLNTLAHEIRTPLAVSQGYLKLLVEGRITNADDARKAMEQTRQALGALATLCMDMGKVSALSEETTSRLRDASVREASASAADFVASLKALDEIKDATWDVDTACLAAAQFRVGGGNYRELAQAVAIVAKAAFDEKKGAAHALKISAEDDLVIHAGSDDALPSLPAAPDAPGARAVDFVKGGKGLKLIWAAFVFEKHGVQAWADTQHRASVAIRIPVVPA